MTLPDGVEVVGGGINENGQLLEQSKDAGIDIYTHSEMLPAHYYPKLKKYSHLKGNYGNAWWKQREEFEAFNGIPTEFQKEQLASCYRSIMACAEENRLESIAFCCISTGEFRFPNGLAAEIAVRTVKDYLATHYDSSIKQLVFNVFKDVDKEIYQQILG